MKILYLPLDSRPCNFIFPVQMAEWAGAECLVPPREIMDRYTTPSSPEEIRRFLEQHAGEADALVISADQLCFGGLLASRAETVSLQEALSRMEILEKIHREYPDRPIHAFSIILRSTISTLRKADIRVSLAVTAYSESSDRYAVLHREEDRLRMEEAKTRIPPEVLRRVQTVRRRNHELNLRCLEARRQGVLSSLSLLMEDSQPYGFHRAEQRILKERMKGIPDTWLHNGTDEGGCTAMARALCPEKQAAAIRWAGRTDGHFTAKYEDRPFEENLRDQLACVRLEDKPEAETVLVIAAPPDGRQEDLHAASDGAIGEGLIREIAEECNRLMAEGRKVYLLDLLTTNGGSPRLLCAVHSGGLAGYSAWNTASNALGTILAQMVTDALAGRPNIPFRNERFLDDMIYEGLIRRELDRELNAAGLDPYRLEDRPGGREEAERRIREMYGELEKDPAFGEVLGAIRAAGPVSFSLPWGRTFEVQAGNRNLKKVVENC